VLAGELLENIEAELLKADAARASGLEGRARVGARRAAGLAMRGYLQARGLPLGRASIFDLISIFRDQPDLSAEVRQVADHLLLRVNTDSELPPSVDLIAETRWLVQILNKD
jgi:hypothetical protein